jgi:hypothetical protein
MSRVEVVCGVLGTLSAARATRSFVVWLVISEIKLCGHSVSNFWKEIERASVGAHCQGEDLLPCYYPAAA